MTTEQKKAAKEAAFSQVGIAARNRRATTLAWCAAIESGDEKQIKAATEERARTIAAANAALAAYRDC